MKKTLIILLMQTLPLHHAWAQDSVAKALQTGNFYLYSYAGRMMGGYTYSGYQSMTVVDDTTIGGVKFFKFDQGFFERSDSLVIEQIGTLDPLLRGVVCDFGRNTGDTISGLTERLIVSARGTASFFGEQHEYMDLTPIMSNGWGKQRYSKKFGEVASSVDYGFASSYSRLEGAIIGNVIYGWVGFLLSTRAMSLDSVEIGAAGAKSLTVRNPTRYAMNLTARTSLPFEVTPGRMTIAPRESSTVTVSFTPTDYGLCTSTISFVDSVDEYSLDVSVSGVGLGAIVALSSSEVDFGYAELGEVHRRSVGLTNTGSACLRIRNVTTSEPSFGVRVVDSVVTVGAQTSIEITFLPVSFGTYASRVIIESNAYIRPDTITLTGVGRSRGNISLLDGVPSSFSLSQNYPNPFNPSTTFRFGIPTPTRVLLAVYNYLGQQLETLMDEEMPAGNFELLWGPTNIPSGVYLYRIRAGSFSETKKLVLLR
jgi:hypothetical protein